MSHCRATSRSLPASVTYDLFIISSDTPKEMIARWKNIEIRKTDKNKKKMGLALFTCVFNKTEVVYLKKGSIYGTIRLRVCIFKNHAGIDSDVFVKYVPTMDGEKERYQRDLNVYIQMRREMVRRCTSNWYSDTSGQRKHWQRTIHCDDLKGRSNRVDVTHLAVVALAVYMVSMLIEEMKRLLSAGLMSSIKQRFFLKG